MLKIGLLFMLSLIVGGQDLRVMTFNVRYPAKSDGPDLWEHRRDLLANTIREQNPDIIGTQELFFEQGEYIVSKLPDYAWFGLSRRGNHEDEHMGIFYRKAKLKVVESGNFWLSETPDQAGSSAWNMSLPRMATWALFETTDGKRFHFYNTHYPHRPQDTEARAQCSKVLAAKLPKQGPLILTGDFNSDAAGEAYTTLAPPLMDAWVVAKKRTGPSGTFHGFGGKPQERRIDWILYRGPWTVTEAETITRKNEANRYPSDHFPVLAVFTSER